MSSPRLRGIARWGLGLLCVFLLLAGWRWQVLRDPPFFECATGLWMEANFLAESNFDYLRLRYQEKYVAEGGPYAYMTSIMPTLIAIAMRATSHPRDVFLLFHLFSIASAALVLVCSYAILAPHTGRALAAASAAAVATTPLFSAQIDMLGMDLPMTAFAVLSALLLLKRWYLSAIVAGLMAYAMKPTGALVTMATIVYLFASLVAAFLARRRAASPGTSTNTPRLLLCWLAAVAALIVEGAVYRWGGINEKLLALILPSNTIFGARIVCPDLILLGAAAFVGTIALALPWVCKRRTAALPAAGPSPTDSQRIQAIALCWLMIVGTLAAIVKVGFVPPRYFTLIVPFVLVCIGLLLSIGQRSARFGSVAIAVLVTINLINWDGKFFPALNEVTTWSRGGDRSRAYLADLRSTIDAVHAIEAQAGGAPVVVGHPFTYFLALPRMGYVQSPLHGYSVNAFENERFPNWAKALVDRPLSLALLWTANHYYHHAMARVPPPEPGDEIIYRSNDPSPLVVYRKRFTRLAWESGEADRWLLENSWQDPADRTKLGARPELLAAFGRPDLALRLLEPAIAADSDNVTLRVKRCQLLTQAGRLDEARRELDTLLAERPRDAEILFRRGVLAEVMRDFELALLSYDAAIAANPNNAAPRFRRAMLSMERSDFKRADDELRVCIRLEPTNAVYRNALGVSLARQGRPDLARREFDEALRIAPGDRTAIENLGQLDRLPPR